MDSFVIFGAGFAVDGFFFFDVDFGLLDEVDLLISAILPIMDLKKKIIMAKLGKLCAEKEQG
jgi:hypothetical protein